MKTETRKRVEIVMERSLLSTVEELLVDAGAKGFTALPCLEGRGEHGAWFAGDLSPAFDRVYLVVLANDQVAEAILHGLTAYLEPYSVIVSVSETQVLRGDRF